MAPRGNGLVRRAIWLAACNFAWLLIWWASGDKNVGFWVGLLVVPATIGIITWSLRQRRAV